MKHILSILPMICLAAATETGDGGGGATPKAEKPKKEPKAPKVEREKKNGVTRPAAGTKTGRVWEIADKLSAEKKAPAERADVLKEGEAEGINPATVTTQYGQWRRFHGLKGRLAAPKPKKAKAPKADTTSQEDLDKQNEQTAAAIEDNKADLDAEDEAAASVE